VTSCRPSYIKLLCPRFPATPPDETGAPPCIRFHGRTAEADHLLQAPLLWGAWFALPSPLSSFQPTTRSAPSDSGKVC